MSYNVAATFVFWWEPKGTIVNVIPQPPDFQGDIIWPTMVEVRWRDNFSFYDIDWPGII